MAELTFVGAAGTVTGSKHLLTVANKRIFIDCGMFQGDTDVRTLNDAPLPVVPDDVDAVVVTHGHLDHVGYLPKLVKDGFSGPIFCTPPTEGVMEIVLDDSANLQSHQAQRGFQHERPASAPLYYDQRDVDRTMKMVRTYELEQSFEVAGVARATYFNAGHILGSAFVKLEFEGKTVVFSGDLGRYGRPLLDDPADIGAADAIVCESTYADRVHPPDPLAALRDALLAAHARGGAIVIPAFAVERTQDLLLSIGALQRDNETIAAIPVHVDSPMAEKVDALFERFPNAHRPIPNDSPGTPFGIRHLIVHESSDESKQLNTVTGSHIIISSSGMASGGRILHHLHNHVGDTQATIVFCGYQGQGTLGFLLTHGAQSIRIYGDRLPVKAAIVALEGFSGHADCNELHRWLATCTGTPVLYAVHGEAASAAALATLAHTSFGWRAQAAQRGTSVSL